MTVELIDLFAGAGGFSLGANSTGLIDLSVGYENDEDAHASHNRHGHCLLADLSDPDLANLERDFGIHLHLHASPPCQTFSAAGKGEGRAAMDALAICVRDVLCGDSPDPDVYHSVPEGSRLSIVPAYWIRELQPETISFEQVRAVLPLWEVYADVLENVYGYNTWTGLLHSEQYGVPQTRTRAWLMATQRDVQVAPPTPTHSRYYSRNPEKLDEGVAPWVSMAQALDWGMTARPTHTVTAGGTSTGGAEPFGNGARKSMRSEQTAGRWIMQGGVSGCGRPRPDTRPAPTVSAKGTATVTDDPSSYYGAERVERLDELKADGPVGRQDWTELRPSTTGRRITVEEALVLQGFPRDLELHGTKTSQFRQIGNAVNPPVAAAIINTLIGDKP